MITGEAGIGKSGVLLQIIDSLNEHNLPILAFRIDQLEPALLPEDIGKQLGLPGSPANVLAAISNGRDCLLVIDQLDVVSQASGRNPRFFECVNEIFKQVRIFPKMKLLMACRRFDLVNDHRLRHLIGEKGIADLIQIEPLSYDTVKSVLEEMGIDAKRFNQRQLEILSLPSHLSLLEEIAKDTRYNVFNFNTPTDLYDLFWKRKQENIRSRIGYSIQWTEVIDALCEYMSDQQELSVPECIVDQYINDAKAMASEHVLVLDNKRYAFFHEGFFDYAFARRFAAKGHELLTFLKSSEQHLFRRSQVRQILLYMRDIDMNRYLKNLKALLTSAEIRYHIKQVVLALSAALKDPTKEEWNILVELLMDQFYFKPWDIWNALKGSFSWFQLLDSLGLINNWLSSEDKENIERSIFLLSGVINDVPDRVAELVAPYIGLSDLWHDRILYLMRRAELSIGKLFFELFLLLIDKGVFNKVPGSTSSNRDIWEFLYSLSEKNPERAVEAIGHYFNYSLDLSMADEQPNPFDESSGHISKDQAAGKILKRIALGDSKAFVKHVLPFMLKVIELNIKREGNPPYRDKVWEYRTYNVDFYIGEMNELLLATMESALSCLAANYPEDFLTISKQFLKSDYETVNYLLIRAYTANGQFFADWAADYLCEQSSRLKTGWSISWNVGNISHLATRKLLEAITPFCSEDRLLQLEKIILSYYPKWEKSVNGYKSFGYAQFILLEAIVPSRRSKTVNHRLAELRRKFGTQALKLPEPSGSLLRAVPSPIVQNKADKMMDDQWLKAISHYDLQDSGKRRNGDLIGGAVELAKILEDQVKKEPERFVELTYRFPNNTNPYYFNAILSGISSAELNVETVLHLCQHCHQLPNKPCGLSICWTIGKFATLPFNKDAFDIVAWYAMEDPDPAQELWQDRSKRGDTYYGGDILTATINSVRGAAAKAIGALIYYDSKRMDYFLPTIKKMIQDPSIAVRAGVAEALTFILNYDADLAVSLFHQLCETDDILMSTFYVERFLHYALETHFKDLEPILKRMIRSPEPEVAIVGARQVCLGSLYLEKAIPLAQTCLSGTDSQRMGAAHVFSANLQKIRNHSFCEEALIKLFHDPEEKIRSIAATCFSDFRGIELNDHSKLIESFVKSPAFVTKPDSLIDALENTTAKLPDVTCMVCERFFDTFGPEAGDTHTAYIADQVSKLIVRIYSQNTDTILKKRCLDLIDRMTQIGVYGLDNVLAVYER